MLTRHSLLALQIQRSCNSRNLTLRNGSKASAVWFRLHVARSLQFIVLRTEITAIHCTWNRDGFVDAGVRDYFVGAGAVSMFVQLLSNEHMKVGNIAGDGSECRDFTIRCGIIQPLLSLIKPEIQVSCCLIFYFRQSESGNNIEEGLFERN